jgi:transposase
VDRATAKRFGCAASASSVAGTAVLSLSSATRVLVATTPVDLRGSFNRLYSLVVEQLKGDPLSGHLFVFTNGRRNRLKVLYWDGSGLWVCAKRLEKGRFTWPVSEEGQVDLRSEQFSALLHGLEVRSKKNWYRR